MIGRRAALASGLAGVAAIGGRTCPAKADAAGSTLRIGNTMPYTGPVSSCGDIGDLETAFFRRVNRQGGIAGRRIKFISLDDGYLPSRTERDAHRLIDKDHVHFLFNTFGTPTNAAIAAYVNNRQVPNLFVASGADAWGDYKKYPWTIGLQPSYSAEARLYTRYILKEKPNARIGILFQDDGFGKDYLTGVHDVLGDKWNRHVVKTASYAVADLAIGTQLDALKSAGADVLICATAPGQAIQAIRGVRGLGWHPMLFMSNVSISVGTVMRPAGMENGIGIISAGWMKDTSDPTWEYDQWQAEWRHFMAKAMPKADLTDNSYIYGYTACHVLMHILVNCNGDFSRENIMLQANSLHRMQLPTLLPGITVSTSPTDHHPIRAMQLQRWSGTSWARFGGVVDEGHA